MVVEHTVDRKTLNVETVYVDGLVEAIKRRLLAGGGFAWMPQTAITAELSDGRLVPIGNEELVRLADDIGVCKPGPV